MAENQIQAYKIDNPDSELLSMQTLIDENYLKSDTCAGGSKKVSIAADGSVTLSN